MLLKMIRKTEATLSREDQQQQQKCLVKIIAHHLFELYMLVFILFGV